MQENKVVIKINYDKPQLNQALSAPADVTVWHVHRIVGAVLAVLALLGVLLAWGLGLWRSDAVESGSQVTSAGNANADLSSVSVNASNKSLETASGKSMLPVSHQPVLTVHDKRVIYTFFNQGVFTQHPYKSVKSSVVVSPSKSVSVFYLTKLTPHSNGVYYHRWRHPLQGDTRPQMTDKQQHTKLYSAKTLTASDLGEWTVQLLDSNDAVLSEVKFWVSLE